MSAPSITVHVRLSRIGRFKVRLANRLIALACRLVQSAIQHAKPCDQPSDAGGGDGP